MECGSDDDMQCGVFGIFFITIVLPLRCYVVILYGEEKSVILKLKGLVHDRTGSTRTVKPEY